jgi:hypothetical protein
MSTKKVEGVVFLRYVFGSSTIDARTESVTD